MAVFGCKYRKYFVSSAIYGEKMMLFFGNFLNSHKDYEKVN